MIKHVEDVFFNGPQPISQALFPSQHLTNRVVKLERGINYFYAKEGLNPSDENSCLVHYIQVHIYCWTHSTTLTSEYSLDVWGYFTKFICFLKEKKGYEIDDKK